jgi:hypothetical protein
MAHHRVVHQNVDRAEGFKTRVNEALDGANSADICLTIAHADAGAVFQLSPLRSTVAGVSRPFSMMRHPAIASPSAIAKPKPPVDPVKTATRPCKGLAGLAAE